MTNNQTQVFLHLSKEGCLSFMKEKWELLKFSIFWLKDLSIFYWDIFSDFSNIHKINRNSLSTQNRIKLFTLRIIRSKGISSTSFFLTIILSSISLGTVYMTFKKWLLLNGPKAVTKLCKHRELAVITPIIMIYIH